MLLTTPLQTGQTPMLMICQIPLHFFWIILFSF
jgi:hypothetical protein